MRKYVEKQVSRHGTASYYFRRSKALPRIRLPDNPSSPEFMQAYRIALRDPENAVSWSHVVETRKQRERAIERCVCNGLSRAKGRAAKKRMEFRLDRVWVRLNLARQGYRCWLTGRPFDPSFATDGKFRPYSPSIDRIDNSKGYTPENCRLVLTAINVMLNDWGVEVLKDVIRGFRFVEKGKAGTVAPRTKSQAPRTTIQAFEIPPL